MNCNGYRAVKKYYFHLELLKTVLNTDIVKEHNIMDKITKINIRVN